MAELTVRFTGADGPMLRRWNEATATAGHGTLSAPWPDRVMLEAHTALKHPELAAAARQAGAPVLIDPLTHLWQDVQFPTHPWVRLPYATADQIAAPMLVGDEIADRLVALCFDTQLRAGATSLIPPYVHIGKHGEQWLAAQVAMWRAASRWRASSGVALPIIPVVALDWTLLAYDRWPAALTTIRVALAELEIEEILLAASKVDDGKTAADRLDDLLSVVEVLSRTWRVTLLRQGTLGEACVVAGAAGYETGIGWGERCDLRAHMSSYRAEPSGHPVRPKYVAAIGQSLAPRTLSAAITDPRLAAALICMDPSCCPGGRAALDCDMRDHGVRRRMADLASIQADHPRWAWRVLAERAEAAAALVERLNTFAGRQSVDRTRPHAAKAVAAVASKRALTAPRRRGVA